MTGGTGFIGRVLVDALLSAGYRVKLLYRPRPHRTIAPRSGLEPVPGDLRDATGLELALTGVSFVCHLGGLTAAARARDFTAVNDHATGTLARAASRAGVERFVLVSSLAAAGPGTADRPLTEDLPPRPISAYGRSKLGGERQVREEIAPDRWVIVRPPIVYGPGDRALLPLFSAISHRLMPQLGFRRRVYSIVHVQDLVDALLLSLVHANASGRTFFVTSRDRLDQSELLARIAAAVGVDAYRVRLPLPLVWAAALGGSAWGRLTGHPVMLSLLKMPELRASAWTCSGALAEGILGFVPRVTLDRGLQETVAWYRHRGWLPSTRQAG